MPQCCPARLTSAGNADRVRVFGVLKDGFDRCRKSHLGAGIRCRMSKKTPYYKENIDAVIGASGEKEAFETDIRRSWCYQKVIKSI